MACRTSLFTRQRDVIASFSLSNPMRDPLVTDNGAGREGLVCPLDRVLTYKNLIYLIKFAILLR